MKKILDKKRDTFKKYDILQANKIRYFQLEIDIFLCFLKKTQN